MKTSDFDYRLPPHLIAQTPVEPRDSSRLLVLDRKTGAIEHRRFFEINNYLHQGDVLVFNDTRVVPARLKGKREPGGGRMEILLLRRLREGEWEVLVKPGKPLRTDAAIEIITPGGAPSGITARVIATGENGLKTLRLSDESHLASLGAIPLPPYIHAAPADPERYQTVYARSAGSAAAPTAGLHFTPGLIEALQNKGISCLFVTLHIGLDTFLPVREEDPRQHTIYREYGVLTPAVAGEINRAKAEGRRVVCVGTTTVRILEHAAKASPPGAIQPFAGWANLFILPGYEFRIADALITNFHLPRSTLLMLVSAFAGKDLVRRAYEVAIALPYRFYSFGDAMLVL